MAINRLKGSNSRDTLNIDDSNDEIVTGGWSVVMDKPSLQISGIPMKETVVDYAVVQSIDRNLCIRWVEKK